MFLFWTRFWRFEYVFDVRSSSLCCRTNEQKSGPYASKKNKMRRLKNKTAGFLKGYQKGITTSSLQKYNREGQLLHQITVLGKLKT